MHLEHGARQVCGDAEERKPALFNQSVVEKVRAFQQPAHAARRAKREDRQRGEKDVARAHEPVGQPLAPVGTEIDRLEGTYDRADARPADSVHRDAGLLQCVQGSEVCEAPWSASSEDEPDPPVGHDAGDSRGVRPASPAEVQVQSRLDGIQPHSDPPGSAYPGRMGEDEDDVAAVVRSPELTSQHRRQGCGRPIAGGDEHGPIAVSKAPMLPLFVPAGGVEEHVAVPFFQFVGPPGALAVVRRVGGGSPGGRCHSLQCLDDTERSRRGFGRCIEVEDGDRRTWSESGCRVLAVRRSMTIWAARRIQEGCVSARLSNSSLENAEEPAVAKCPHAHGTHLPSQHADLTDDMSA